MLDTFLYLFPLFWDGRCLMVFLNYTGRVGRLSSSSEVEELEEERQKKVCRVSLPLPKLECVWFLWLCITSLSAGISMAFNFDKWHSWQLVHIQHATQQVTGHRRPVTCLLYPVACCVACLLRSCQQTRHMETKCPSSYWTTNCTAQHLLLLCFIILSALP